MPGKSTIAANYSGLKLTQFFIKIPSDTDSMSQVTLTTSALSKPQGGAAQKYCKMDLLYQELDNSDADYTSEGSNVSVLVDSVRHALEELIRSSGMTKNGT